ncbi:uncharacterized protein LOC125024996 [Penaeus chinensis]|uniref:uncharacterized protein LOC125024996 n=1 Tax=Penaeus chinensis TaxID=139456 RepID=UPI001FB7B38E|nr:uncharacterized protein LOC125024996 [Penaeus chinensis]
MLGPTGMPRVGHSVTWSDREVSVLSPPVPHILVSSEGSALSRLDRYFDPQPPPRPAKPVGLLPKPGPAALSKPSQQPPQPASGPPPLIDGAACKTSTWTYKHVTSARNSGVSDIEKGARFRPERRERRPVQKLQWRDSAWSRGFTPPKDDYLDLDTRMTGSSSADGTPRHAMKRILLLTENYQYRDAAAFIQRLPAATFKAILSDLPIDVLVDAMPHSLPIVEALYCKVAETASAVAGSTRILRPDAVVWQMVRFFAQQEECLTGDIRWEFCGPFVTSCKKVLRVISRSEPKIRKTLQMRRKQLEKAIEGMGHHGLVGTSDESLQSLHDALKLEFERVVKSYTQALEKLEELSLSNKASVQRSISHGPAPVQASHQRQLSITQEEVQQRLIKNKTLLNVVEPTLGNHSLDVLLGILQRRIEYDKESLFQFTQLRKEAKEVDGNAVIAPILMRYSHGCEQVLEMLKEAMEEDGGHATMEEDDGSDVSGYHSDSDSAIMMSGNSPYVSKHARFNFLTRSVRDRARVGIRSSLPFSTAGMAAGACSSGLSSGSSDTQSQSSGGDHKSDTPTPEGTRKNGEVSSSSSSASSSTSGVASGVSVRCGKGHELPVTAGARESAALRQEVETLRAEITKARQTILHMQEREKKLKERLGERASRGLERSGGGGGRVENLSLGERRPSALVRRYGNLYAQARVDTLDSLDALPDLKNAEELKSKLLFSVVVLAFRSASASAASLREEVRRVMQVPPPPPTGDIHSQDHYAHDPHTHALEMGVSAFLTANIDKHDLTKNVDEVCQQIWATLYDYPALKSCEGLLQYIKDCVRLAWGLSNQTPAFMIDYETRVFRKEYHVRFHTADPESDAIKTYLWPALLEGPGGTCVQKGVVIT